MNYPYWAGRLQGFLKGISYWKLPDNVKESIDNILKEYEEARKEDLTQKE